MVTAHGGQRRPGAHGPLVGKYTRTIFFLGLTLKRWNFFPEQDLEELLFISTLQVAHLCPATVHLLFIRASIITVYKQAEC